MAQLREIAPMFNQHAEMFSVVSSYLGDSKEGDLTRALAGGIRFRETIKGKTYENGQLHSFEGKPAFQDEYGTSYWYKHGAPHRDGGLPAIIFTNGSMCWYTDGNLDRAGDLPASIGYKDGVLVKCRWYRNGVPHRDGNLPSVITQREYKFHQGGSLHREDGNPASVRFLLNCVHRQWCVRGEIIDEDFISYEDWQEEGEHFQLNEQRVW
jgi:hypothetical protein